MKSQLSAFKTQLLRDNQLEIIKLLVNNKPLRVTEIALKIKNHRPNTYEELTHLEELGIVTRFYIGDIGYFRISDKEKILNAKAIFDKQINDVFDMLFSHKVKPLKAQFTFKQFLHLIKKDSPKTYKFIQLKMNEENEKIKNYEVHNEI